MLENKLILKDLSSAIKSIESYLCTAVLRQSVEGTPRAALRTHVTSN